MAAYDTEILQKIKAAKPAAPIIDITHRVSYIEINAVFSFTEYDGLWVILLIDKVKTKTRECYSQMTQPDTPKGKGKLSEQTPQNDKHSIAE